MGPARERVSFRAVPGGPVPTRPNRRRPRRGIPVLLRGESRLASRGRRRAPLLEPARRPRAAGRGRPVFRRWLPRASRAASRRERGDKEGGEAVYRGGAAGLRRVRRPHVPGRDARGRRRRRAPDGGCAARRGQDAAATHGARLHGGRAHERHTDRPRGGRRARPRVPLLDPRPRAGRRRARLSDRRARRDRARGGLSRRPDAHELRPPPLRLEPRAPARLREGMRRVGAVRAPALVLGLLLAVSPPAEAFSARDMLGREVALAAPPARIVSLVPSVTEVLFALGAEARLVGVTDFCDYPPAARVSDVTDLIARLGALTGSQHAAAPLLRRLEQRVAAVARAVAPLPHPRVLYVLWPEPLIVPGREALVTELIRLAGGQSVTADEADAYPRLSLESAVARAPEVILLANHGANTGPIDEERWRRLTSLPAVRAGRLHRVEGNLVHRYGPRVVDGLELLARAIHPEAFE